MTKSPLISVIIPTYNRAHIIGEALDSIIKQTYQNWECIVVDDGSTDDTNKLIKTYLEKDKRLRFYKRPDTLVKGPSACRNYGYEKSKGAYIQWFDSDDLMHPDKLKIKIEAALTYQAQVIIDKHDTGAFIEIHTDYPITHFTSHDFYIDYILGKKPVITNDVMLKKDIIGSQRFDAQLWKGEEYEFFSRVFKQKLIYCFLDVVLTNYSVSPDSISTHNNQHESLILLSKKLQLNHSTNHLIVAKAKYQGRKTYKNLIKTNHLKVVFANFQFFKNCHNKSSTAFLAFIIYNSITKRGFDKIKPK